MANPDDCIRRNFRAFNEHDVEGVIDTYTTDAELVDVAAPAPVYGHDFLREHMANLLGVFPDIHIEGERLLSGPRLVAAEFVLVGTHGGEFLGYLASGNVIRWKTCSWFELTEDENRIEREIYYYDIGSVTAQLSQK